MENAYHLQWNYDQVELVPGSFGKFGIVQKIESRQSERNLTSVCFFFFFYHSHKGLTNRFLRVNNKQPKTAVTGNVHLPVSLSSSLQLQRDTPTTYSFFQRGGQGWTWKVSITGEEALSLAAAIWDGDDWRNMAEHCRTQWAIPLSLKQRANKSHQLEHFLNCHE